MHKLSMTHVRIIRMAVSIVRIGMFTNFQKTLTFDDVLLVPQESEILPKDTILQSRLARDIKLNLPFLSAPMDTVTEHRMAIGLALSGGIGIIHKNLSVEEQAGEVQKVKRFQNSFIKNPVTVLPEDKISRVAEIRSEFGYKKIPVVTQEKKLVGFISDTDYFFPQDKDLQVSSRMKPLVSMIAAKDGISLEDANQMIYKHRLSTLCVVDDDDRLVSIVTRKDIEKNELYPIASKDGSKHLRVGAAVGVGDDALLRAEALISAGADVIVIDTAHGHSRGVIQTLQNLRKQFSDQPFVAGNIVTGKAAIALAEAGADAIKVGVGPGSICTTRIVAGVGVPQISAILEVVQVLRAARIDIPVIADGGIRNSGDIVKAFAAGAEAVMMGNMLAGTDESPGQVEFIDGRMFKLYRGMGSIEAMAAGSRDRYGQGEIKEKKKFVPEGVSGRVQYKGPAEKIIYQLSGGLRSGMGYCGAKTIKELQEKARFVRVSSAGSKESHPHDLDQFDSAPNYNG